MRRKKKGLNRRQFLGRAVGVTLVGGAAMPFICRCNDEDAASSFSLNSTPVPCRGRVVRFRHPEILDAHGRIGAEASPATGKRESEKPPDESFEGNPTGEGRQRGKADRGALNVLESTLGTLMGCRNLGDSLARLFSKGERVGIKLNCLAGRGLSPHPPLVRALVDGLLAAGIDKEGIIVFERSERELRRAGFPISRTKGPLFLGTDSPGMGYEPTPLLHKSIGSCFCRILTREIDALINFGVLKDHNLAGISVGLKNLFGLIHNPNKYHGDNCNPFVADTLDAPPVKKKLRLTLCDGLVSQFHGGPGLLKKFTWKPGLFLASCDPVAIDAVGWAVIEKKRKEMGLSSLAEDGRNPAYIATACRYGLGEADLDSIKIIDV